MQNTFQALWEENSFYVLGIPPSAGRAEVRRALDQARLEVAMGMRGLGEDDLEQLTAALRSDESAFEMRLFAEWHGDPVLGGWADAHDAAAAAVLHPHAGTRPSEALAQWLALVRAPGLPAAMQPFLSEGVALRERWGGCAVDLVRAGVRKGESPAAFLGALGRDAAIDPAPVVAEVVATAVHELEAASADSRVDAGENGGVPAHRAATVESRFMAAAGVALEVVQVLTDGGVALFATLRKQRESLLEAVKASSYAVSTGLHNGESFAAADRVIRRALDFPHAPATRQELLDDLALVRRVWGSHRFRDGMERDDFAEALAGLDLVIGNTVDEDERAQALAMKARVEQAKRHAERGPLLRFWDRNSGWIIWVGIIGGIVLATSLYDSNEETPTASWTPDTRLPAYAPNTQVTYRPVIPTVGPVTRSLGASVGDCVSLTEMRVVSCFGRRHDGRVLAKPRLTGISYPSWSNLGNQADRRCPAGTRTYIPPSRASWDDGDRELLCLDR